MKGYSLSSSQSGQFALLFQSPCQIAMDLDSCPHILLAQRWMLL